MKAGTVGTSTKEIRYGRRSTDGTCTCIRYRRCLDVSPRRRYEAGRMYQVHVGYSARLNTAVGPTVGVVPVTVGIGLQVSLP